MHACFLDMFHDAGHVHIVPVADRVDIDFNRVREVAVDEQRLVAGDQQSLGGKLAQVLVITRNLHRAPAQHERGTQHDGIADLARLHFRFLDAARGTRRRLLDAQLVEKSGELLAVFRQVDRFRRRAKDRHFLLVKRSRQFQRRLSAELDDQAHQLAAGLLLVHDFHHVLDSQWFEVKPV